MERNSRKFLIGVVTSNKMQKTITVKIETKFKHPLYRKLVIHNKKYHVHDENEIAMLVTALKLWKLDQSLKLLIELFLKLLKRLNNYVTTVI